VRDHRLGTTARVGQASAVSVDRWSDDSGVKLWSLGLEIDGLSVAGGDTPTASFTLTDRAAVTLEVADAVDGRVLARRTLAPLAAGAHLVPLQPDDLRAAMGHRDFVLRVSAASGYASGATTTAEASFRADGGAATTVTRPMLLGNWPNPMRASTRIAFVLPSARVDRAALGVYDATGRRVRALAGAFAPGLNEVVWDGTDERGVAARAGLYFYRLDVGDAHFTRRMALVR